MGSEKEPLTQPHRDETRTAYILQAVESAWEGVDRQKAMDAKDSSVPKDPNRDSSGVMVTAEPTSQTLSQLENSEEEEVCVHGVPSPASPTPVSQQGSGRPPFLVSTIREKGFFWNGQPQTTGQFVLPSGVPKLKPC